MRAEQSEAAYRSRTTGSIFLSPVAVKWVSLRILAFDGRILRRYQPEGPRVAPYCSLKGTSRHTKSLTDCLRVAALVFVFDTSKCRGVVKFCYRAAATA